MTKPRRLSSAPLTLDDLGIWCDVMRRFQPRVSGHVQWDASGCAADRRDADIMLSLGIIPRPPEWTVYRSIAHEQIKLGQLVTGVLENMALATYPTSHKRQ